MPNLTPTETTLLRLLPFYIEHQLLDQKLRKAKPWERNPTDPTWQALCRYYSLCVKLEPAGANEEDVKAFRQWLESGNAEADYPTCWDANDVMQLRDPQAVSLNFAGPADGYANVSKAPGARLPLTGFEAHKKSKPSGVLTLSKIEEFDDYPLVILDDALFKSADYIYGKLKFPAEEKESTVNSVPAPQKILVGHTTLDADDVRREIWRRWETGSECAEPPEIEAEDGKRFPGPDYISTIMAEHLHDFSQVRPMLTAILQWQHDQDQVVKAMAAVIRRWIERDSVGMTSKCSKLPQDQRELLAFTGGFVQILL